MRIMIRDRVYEVVEVIPDDLTVTFRLADGCAYDSLVWHAKRMPGRKSKIDTLFMKGFLNLSNLDVTANV